jgi:transposase
VARRKLDALGRDEVEERVVLRRRGAMHRVEHALVLLRTGDGSYVLPTSLPVRRLEAAQTVRSYKQLARLERAFGILQSLDLEMRPLHHCRADRVRADVLICVLAYYYYCVTKKEHQGLLASGGSRGNVAGSGAAAGPG